MTEFVELTAAGWIALALIAAGWVYACSELVRIRAGLSRESAAIEALKELGRQAPDEADAAAAAQVSERLKAWAQETQHRTGSPVAFERVEALLRAAPAGFDIDRSLLAETSAGALQEPLRVPRAAANILVLLGLAGTLVGLTFAVSGLSEFQQADPDAASGVTASGPSASTSELDRERIDNLFNAVNRTLDGLRTAFVPAALAVVLTVLLLAMLHPLERRVVRVGLALERVTDSVLLPALRPPKTSQSVRSLTKASLDAAGSLATAAQDASNELKRGVQAVGDQLSEVARAATDSTRGASKELIEAARTVATKAEETKGTLEAVAGEVAARVRSADETTARLATFLAAAEDQSRDMRERAEALHEPSEHLSQAVRALDGVVQRLGEHVAADRKGVEALAADRGRFVAALEDLALTRKTFNELVNDLRSSSLDSGRAAAERHHQIVSRIDDLLSVARSDVPVLVEQAKGDGVGEPVAVPDTRRDVERLTGAVVDALALEREAFLAEWRSVVGEVNRRWADEHQQLERIFRDIQTRISRYDVQARHDAGFRGVLRQIWRALNQPL